MTKRKVPVPANDGAPAQPRSAPAAAPPIEARRLSELDAALGSVRLAGLLGLLAEDCRTAPGLLRAGHARGDLDGVRAEALRLNIAALAIGANALGEAAVRLAASPDLALASPLIEALDDAARATLGAARGLLGYSGRVHSAA